MKRQRTAYSYVRFSTREQRKGGSKRRQKDAAEKWCEEHGYTLDTSIKMIDDGRSGHSGEHLLKGKLGHFIELAEAGKVKKGSVLIVESLDRLTRQAVPVALRLFLHILELEIDIVTLLEPVEWFKHKTLDETQLIIAIIVLSRAHNESATKAKRLANEWTHKRAEYHKTGKLLTAKVPSWIRKKGNKFELITETADVVRHIVDLYLSGMGVVAISKQLNREQVPTFHQGKRKAKQWSKSTVQRILNSRSLIGEFTPHHGSKNQDQSQRKPAGDPIPGYYPAVLDEPTFYKVQKQLKAKKIAGRTGKDSSRISNLFTQMVFDARDGSPLHMVDKGARAGGKQLVSSAARSGLGQYISFNYDAFESAMLELMKTITPADIMPPKKLMQSSTLDKRIVDAGKIDERIASIQKRLETADDALIQSVMPVLSKLAKQKEALQTEIEELRGQQHSPTPTADDCNRIAELLQQDNSVEHRRRFRLVARELIERMDCLILKEGHWRQCFVRILFESGKTRIVVIGIHRKRLVASGGFDGDYPITETKTQRHLQERLREMKVRSVAETEKNLESQLIQATVGLPGYIEIKPHSISYEVR